MPIYRINDLDDLDFADVEAPLPPFDVASYGDAGHDVTLQGKGETGYSAPITRPPVGTRPTIVGDGEANTFSYTGGVLTGAETMVREWLLSSAAGTVVAGSGTTFTRNRPADDGKTLSLRITGLAEDETPSDPLQSTNSVFLIAAEEPEEPGEPAPPGEVISVTSVTIMGVTYGLSAVETPGTPVDVVYDCLGNVAVLEDCWVVSTTAPFKSQPLPGNINPPVPGNIRWMNGWQKNPPATRDHPFDTLTGTYSHAREGAPPSLPLRLQDAGDLFFQYVSRESVTYTVMVNGSEIKGDERTGLAEANNVIYRPTKPVTVYSHTPRIWWTPSDGDFSKRPDYEFNHHAWVAGLPAPLDVSGLGTVPWSYIKPYLARFSAMYGIVTAGAASEGYEINLLYREHGFGGNYGRDYADTEMMCTIGLVGNEWSAEDKAEYVKWRASWGFQAYDANIERGFVHNYTDGGHYLFAHFPKTLYLMTSGRQSERPMMRTRFPGALGISYQITAEMLEELTKPHKWIGRNKIARVRRINAVQNSGKTLRMEWGGDRFGSDGGKDRFNFNSIIRMRTGEERRITENSPELKAVQGAVSYLGFSLDQAFSDPPVELDETFFCQAAENHVHGGTISSVGTSFFSCTGSPMQPYRDIARVAGPLIAYGWLGWWESWMDTTLEEFLKTLRVNFPFPGKGDYDSWGGSFNRPSPLTGVFYPQTFITRHQSTLWGEDLSHQPETVGVISAPSAVALSGAQAKVTVTVTGTNQGIYAIALPVGSPAPTGPEVVARAKASRPTVNDGKPWWPYGVKDALTPGTYSLWVQHLEPATSYTVYIALEDWGGTITNAVPVNVTTAPQLSKLYENTMSGMPLGSEPKYITSGGFRLNSTQLTWRCALDPDALSDRVLEVHGYGSSPVSGRMEDSGRTARNL